ncbi:hypothetical protein HAX54_004541 [Datura stramonium]|uniref:Uncharacterized protein n=1 Tax=Datura stramonium TaxID=4076 RepID=A0ABS8T8P6_DATST|nr:hypothetical protein [Datura stramonium]
MVKQQIETKTVMMNEDRNKGKIEEGDQGTPKSRENQSHMPNNASQGSVTANKKEENKEIGLESTLVIWNSEMIKEKRDDHLVSSEGEGEILKVSDDDVQRRKVIPDLQELSGMQKEYLQEQREDEDCRLILQM